MNYSVPSAVVTAVSPAKPLPNAPVIDSVTFNKLVGTIVLTMPTTDKNSDPLTDNLDGIRVFFGPTGTDLSTVPPAEFPGSYAPGSQQTVQVTVPSWETSFDFEAEAGDE